MEKGKQAHQFHAAQRGGLRGKGGRVDAWAGTRPALQPPSALPPCPRLLPNFSPRLLPSGASATSGEPGALQASVHLFLKKQNKTKQNLTHSQYQQWSGAHCTHPVPLHKAAQTGSRVLGCALNASGAAVLVPLSSPTSERRAAREERALGRAPFRVWESVPRSLASRSRRASSNYL